MKKSNTWSVAAVFFSLSLFSGQSLAMLVGYTSFTDWEATLDPSSLATEDFESVAATVSFGGGSTTVNALTFNSNASSPLEAQICVSTTTSCGGPPNNSLLRLGSLDFTEFVEVELGQFVTAIAFDWFATEGVSGRTISALVGSEVFFTTPDASTLPPNGTGSRTGFFGVTSDTQFDRFLLQSNSNATNASFDNIRIGNVADAVSAPAPATWLLLLVGVAGAIMRHHRSGHSQRNSI